MFEIKGKYTTAKVMADQLEESCVAQITSFINHPAFTNPVSIMPDAHTGKGSCIGFTMKMTDKVIPQIIGVDIGCSVMAINIGNKLPLSEELIDHKIRQRVPMGINVHDRGVIHMKNNFPWKDVQTLAHKFTLAYSEKFNKVINPPIYNMDWFEKKCKSIGADLGRMINSIGTLGGGNHFIEIGKDLNDDYWITIHTGSRNFGKRICEYWQSKAEKRIKKDFQEQKQKEIDGAKQTYSDKELFNKIKEIKSKYNFTIDINGLEFLEDEDASGYLFDMIFTQIYAEVNRKYIAESIIDILGVPAIDKIETVHNFIDFRDFIIRKGAIRSYIGERMIIPFNMRDGLLICEGRSNSEWNCSAPHGAGRVLSRSQAKKQIDLVEFKNQMQGIYSTSVGLGTLDESPNAYKDSKIIEEAVKPTAVILNRVIPVINIKAIETVED